VGASCEKDGRVWPKGGVNELTVLCRESRTQETTGTATACFFTRNLPSAISMFVRDPELP